MDIVPFPDYVCPDGPMNLAAYFGSGTAFPPDLGPKTYIASGRYVASGPTAHIRFCLVQCMWGELHT
jgi:hypothetical protein